MPSLVGNIIVKIETNMGFFEFDLDFKKKFEINIKNTSNNFGVMTVIFNVKSEEGIFSMDLSQLDKPFLDKYTQACRGYAVHLGIDIEKEPELLHIAEEAIKNIPEDWNYGIGEGNQIGKVYFFNIFTNESDWIHPEEDKYIKIVKYERSISI